MNRKISHKNTKQADRQLLPTSPTTVCRGARSAFKHKICFCFLYWANSFIADSLLACRVHLSCVWLCCNLRALSLHGITKFTHSRQRDERERETANQNQFVTMRHWNYQCSIAWQQEAAKREEREREEERGRCWWQGGMACAAIWVRNTRKWHWKALSKTIKHTLCFVF